MCGIVDKHYKDYTITNNVAQRECSNITQGQYHFQWMSLSTMEAIN